MGLHAYVIMCHIHAHTETRTSSVRVHRHVKGKFCSEKPQTFLRVHRCIFCFPFLSYSQEGLEASIQCRLQGGPPRALGTCEGGERVCLTLETPTCSAGRVDGQQRQRSLGPSAGLSHPEGRGVCIYFLEKQVHETNFKCNN